MSTIDPLRRHAQYMSDIADADFDTPRDAMTVVDRVAFLGAIAGGAALVAWAVLLLAS